MGVEGCSASQIRAVWFQTGASPVHTLLAPMTEFAVRACAAAGWTYWMMDASVTPATLDSGVDPALMKGALTVERNSYVWRLPSRS
jgi:hypothetical protein